MMKEGEGLKRLVCLAVAMAVIVGWSGTVLAQTTISRSNPPIDPATGEEIWFEDEADEPTDLPFNPQVQRLNSALDRAFGYVWEGDLEQRYYNIPHGGALGISSEFYRSGIQGAARERDRFNVRHTLALGVGAGPWLANAQVHENSGYFIGTGNSSYVSDAEWEAKDGSRGVLFADPPQTRFDVPLLAIQSLEATWPTVGGTPTWPAPEDVEEVWAGTDTWKKWERKTGDEFYGEFDDAYATRRGTGEQAVLDVSGQFRVMQYGTNTASYFQFELTNNSNYTYTDVYVGHFERRRLLVSDGNEMFPRWDPVRQFTYAVGPDYFEKVRGEGTHSDDDGDPAPWGGWLFLESPTGSQRTDALGDTLTPGPNTVITRRAYVEYGERVRGGDHEWGLYSAMSGDPSLFEDPAKADDIWKHLTLGGGSPILLQDESIWAQHVYGPSFTAMTDSLTEVNHTSFNYLSSGPIPLWAPGEKIIWDIAFVCAPDENTLLANVDKAIRTYQARLESSGPPPVPTLEIPGTTAGPDGRQITQLHAYPIKYVPSGSVTLTWDGSISETTADPITAIVDFQGYRIYRSIDRGNSWGESITDENAIEVAFKPVAQFDKKDGITGLDPQTYLSLGTDSGLQHTWTDSDVLDGVEYWYAITSYDYETTQDPTFDSFESAIGANPNAANVVAVMSGTRPNGYRAGFVGSGMDGADYYLYLPTDTEREVSVFATVIDDVNITGDSYSVTVVGDSSWYGPDLYPLDAGVLISNVTRSTDFFTLPVLGSKEALGLDNIPVTDGFRIVTMPPMDAAGVVVEDGGVFSFEITTDMSDSTNYTVRTAEAFMEGSGSAANRANRTGFMNEVEFRFTGWIPAPGDTNWIFTRAGGGYLQGELIQCPFEMWDVETNTRLMPGNYWPGQPFWDGYRFIVTPVPYYDTDGVTVKPFTDTHPSSDTEYWGYDTSNPNSRSDWAYRLRFNETSFSTNEDYWDVGDVWTMLPYKTLQGLGGQTFNFATTAAAIEDTLIDYDDIKAVPNPYLIRAEWDRNENSRSIYFTNVPVNATIDIYTINGELIASLDHGPTYNSTEIGTVRWNIWTYEYTEVAYGLYIYVVKVGDNVKKVGKLAIIR